MRIIVRLSMSLVALSAAALSFQSLMRLGQLCGYGSLAGLYPLVLDLGAASSCAAWLHARSRQALGMTWGLLGCSVVLNGTVHFLDATHTAPSWLLVVAVAAMPPTVLGLCVHLAVGLGGHPAGSMPPVDVLDEFDDADEPPDFWRDAPFATTPGGRAAELLEQGAGRRRLARELGISEHRARQLKAGRDEATS
jgi:hypothetical protein